MTYALEVHSLTKLLGGQRVLDRLDVSIMAGESVALRGANGAGKTTLLRCLANLCRPTSGSVLWFGQPCQQVRTRPLGLVGHESFLYGELTAQENLLLAARLYGLPQPKHLVEEWLERTFLTKAAQRPAAQLSRGMRQRLAIARALLHNPPLVLLDEPFAALDDDSQAWLIRLFGELRGGGRTLCFTSHDEQLSQQLADRVLWLEAGQLIEKHVRHGSVALAIREAA